MKQILKTKQKKPAQNKQTNKKKQTKKKNLNKPVLCFITAAHIPQSMLQNPALL